MRAHDDVVDIVGFGKFDNCIADPAKPDVDFDIDTMCGCGRFRIFEEFVAGGFFRLKTFSDECIEPSRWFHLINTACWIVETRSYSDVRRNHVEEDDVLIAKSFDSQLQGLLCWIGAVKWY